MRIIGPLGAGLLLQFVTFVGCSAPVNSRDKESSATKDALAATEAVHTKSGATPAELATHPGAAEPDAVNTDSASGDSASAERVAEDGGLRVVRSDAGQDAPQSSESFAERDAADQEPSLLQPDSGATDRDVPSEDESSSPPSATDGPVDAGVDAQAPEASVACADTLGHCDPTGSCAQDSCQFETSGKSCAFTPLRVVPFTCVIAGNTPDYAPCDLDDACKSGSVCVADTFIGRDVNGAPVARRSGTMCRPTCDTDEDCPEGDWCQQATDEANAPLADLRVCHRYCQDPLQCYDAPVSGDVRCTPRDTQLGLEESECSRKPSNLVPPVPVDTTDDTTTGEPELGTTSRSNEVTISIEADLLLQRTANAVVVSAATSYCLSNWDCETDALCVGNACRVGCEHSAECSDGAQCVWVDAVGVCGDACNFDAEAGDTCSVTPNCGCPEGQTCRVNDDQSKSCSALGEQGYMDWCTRQNQCGEGLSCISGLCRPNCVPGVSECALGHGECVLSIKSATEETFTCSGNCDPVDPRSSEGNKQPCGLGAVCLPSWDAELYPHALCVSENPERTPRSVGGACTQDTDCASGLGCDASGACQHWCRSTSDCNRGQHCAFAVSIYGVVTRLGAGTDDPLGLCQGD